MKLGCAWVACAAALVLVGCAEPAPAKRTFVITLAAHSDSTAPLSDARAWINGKAMGATDEAGTLTMRSLAVPGDTLELLLACPRGYEAEQPERRLSLRGMGLGDEGRQPAPLRVALRCRALEPLAALVVRAAPNLPVLVDGKRMGQTDADGTEHLLLRATPGTTMQVTLDTSDAPALLPQHPVTTLSIEARDQLLLINQAFTLKPKGNRSRREPVAPPPPKPQRPQRIR